MKLSNLQIALLCGILIVAFYVAPSLAHGDDAAHELANPSYTAVSSGTRLLSLGPVSIKMLVDKSNLGEDKVEVAELTLPADHGEGVAHAHGSLEIFYVVSGILGHEVNGEQHALKPGDVGFVKPGDQIRHSVLSETAVKAVVIWVPGGESQALIDHAGFEVETIE